MSINPSLQEAESRKGLQGVILAVSIIHILYVYPSAEVLNYMVPLLTNELNIDGRLRLNDSISGKTAGISQSIYLGNWLPVLTSASWSFKSAHGIALI